MGTDLVKILEIIIKMPRPKIIMMLCIISLAVASGFLVLLSYWPQAVSDFNIYKILTISTLLAAPVVMSSFVVISVMGHASGKPRNTQIFMTEFAFALFTCFLSYGLSLLASYLVGFGLKGFIICVLILAPLFTWIFIRMREHTEI